MKKGNLWWSIMTVKTNYEINHYGIESHNYEIVIIMTEIYILDTLWHKTQLCPKVETDIHISDQVEMDIKHVIMTKVIIII